MAAKIFISYRRADSGGTASHLRDWLAQTFGRQSVFLDVDSIPAGVDFAADLNRQIAQCRVFLAVIGPNWLDEKDESGARRLDRPDDLLSKEIAAALARDPSVVSVIPVLVDGARMPEAEQLPDPVKGLARLNGVEVRNAQFDRDADALIAKVREALGQEGAWLVWRRRAAGAVPVAAAALLVIGLTAYLWKSSSRPPAVESSIVDRTAPVVEGGARSSTSAWPWLVSVFLHGGVHCNGTLIAAKAVLTTADCARGGLPINFEVVTAVDDGKGLKLGKRVRVAKINRHPGNLKAQDSDDPEKDDIAILELGEEFPPPFATISTRRQSDPEAGTRATVAAVDFRSLPGILLQSPVPILDDADCFEGRICAGFEPGGGRACGATGSAGAPLVLEGEGRKYQVGLFISGSDCIGPSPGGGSYTRISSYADWIKQIVPGVLSEP